MAEHKGVFIYIISFWFILYFLFIQVGININENENIAQLEGRTMTGVSNVSPYLLIFNVMFWSLPAGIEIPMFISLVLDFLLIMSLFVIVSVISDFFG